VRDLVAFESAGVVEVELFEAFAGGEPGGADAAFTAVGLPGGDLSLHAGDEKFLVGPRLGAGALSEPVDGLPQGWGLQCSGEERDLGGQVSWRVRGGGHQKPTTDFAGGQAS
jgi:hypothetical protein